MEAFKSGEMEFQKGATLMAEGVNSPHMYTVLSGMGLRYKTLENGERQVLSFVLPGDFIGLQAGIMNEMKHSVEASQTMRLCVFDRAQLWTLFASHPGRAYDVTWISAVEEYFLGESLSIVARMSGEERIAEAYLRLYERGRSLDMLVDGKMPLPYRQQDLADALGLSLVHTNKTIASLRERRIASWQKGMLRIWDIEKLKDLTSDTESVTSVMRPLI